MTKYYAGIGARKTPVYILRWMTSVAQQLEIRDYMLRSGGAQGADKAFEAGIREQKNKEVFRPEDATQEAMRLASEVHPAWHRCNDYARRLLGRNAQILLGRNLDTPVDFVLCWTPGGRIVGGTGHSIQLAHKHSIRVFNFSNLTLQEFAKYQIRLIL